MQPAANPVLYTDQLGAFHAGLHRPGEDDMLDWSGTIHMSGTAAARPAASNLNKGCLYLSTDVNGGTLYRSDGATWTQVALGVTQGASGAPPTGAAGGLLGGTYPNPTTAAGNTLIQNTDVGAAAAIAKTKLAALNVGQADMATGFRAVAVSAAAPGSPAAFDTWWDTTNKLLKVRDAGNANWITITPQSNSVTTSETTTSATYANLATNGPAVTLLTGTSVLVSYGAFLNNNNGLVASLMSFAVSGATTLAASDANSCGTTGNALNFSAARTQLITGLTAGSNTFTAKYKSDGSNTLTAANRDITVTAIPT